MLLYRDDTNRKLTQAAAGHIVLRKEQINIAKWDHPNEKR
jgi:hypothetical protein